MRAQLCPYRHGDSGRFFKQGQCSGHFSNLSVFFPCRSFPCRSMISTGFLTIPLLLVLITMLVISSVLLVLYFCFSGDLDVIWDPISRIVDCDWVAIGALGEVWLLVMNGLRAVKQGHQVLYVSAGKSQNIKS